MYWKLKRGSAAEILLNIQNSYAELKSRNMGIESEKQFIDRMLKIADNEKYGLSVIMQGLAKCLRTYHFIPQMDYHYVDPMIAIIKKHNPNQRYFTITQLKAIDQEIEKLTQFSLMSPRQWIRSWAFPDEREVIEEYWKLYQIIAHLDAVQECLKRALE